MEHLAANFPRARRAGPARVMMSEMTMIWSLIRPSTSLLFLLLAGMALVSWGRYRRTGLALLWGGGLILVVILFFPVGQWAMSTLERQFPPLAAAPDHIDGIIVLGGAMTMSVSDSWRRPSLTDGAERMTEFVALALRYPEARLVFAGGAGTQMPGAQREADVARQFFEQMGIAPDRVVYEDESQTTWENAVFSQRLAKPGAGETWLLVTSAFHMPRALAAFHRAGWPVAAWPVGYKSNRDLGIAFEGNLPKELHFLDDAAHEWIGGWVYRVTGRGV